MPNNFTLLPDEKIIVLARRHWLTLAIKLLLAVIFTLLPVLIIAVLSVLAPSLTLLKDQKFFLPMGWYFSSLFWLILWCWGVLTWLDWYLDVWILTDKRVIDIEQRKFFNRHIVECSLSKVQNVSTRVTGPIATFLDFGTVEIKTADDINLLAFEKVPHPGKIQNALVQAHHEYLKNIDGKNGV